MTLDLDHASDIAGCDDVRIGAGDVPGLSLTKRSGHFGLQEIIGSRRAAAEMLFGDIEHGEAGPRATALSAAALLFEHVASSRGS